MLLRVLASVLRSRPLTFENASSMGRALDAVTAEDVRGFFGHCGYRRVGQLL